MKVPEACPRCGDPLERGMFIAPDGEFLLDAGRCQPCMMVWEPE